MIPPWLSCYVMDKTDRAALTPATSTIARSCAGISPYEQDVSTARRSSPCRLETSIMARRGAAKGTPGKTY